MTDSNQAYHSEHLAMYVIVKALCMPETNVILYVKQTSVKNKNKISEYKKYRLFYWLS